MFGFRRAMSSAMPFWPLRPWHVALPELLGVVFVALACAPLVLCIPLTIALTAPLLPAFRFLRTFRRRSYFRDPASCRVAVVGAGWSGLAVSARLRALGVEVHGFEGNDDVGGTWHPSRLYPGLALHTPAYGASFAGFPYPSDGTAQEVPDERPSGRAMYAYLRRFAETHDLLGAFSFCTRVASVSYDSRTHTASISLERRQKVRAHARTCLRMHLYIHMTLEPTRPPS